jgi:hypothetical protein
MPRIIAVTFALCLLAGIASAREPPVNFDRPPNGDASQAIQLAQDAAQTDQLQEDLAANRAQQAQAKLDRLATLEATEQQIAGLRDSLTSGWFVPADSVRSLRKDLTTLQRGAGSENRRPEFIHLSNAISQTAYAETALRDGNPVIARADLNSALDAIQAARKAFAGQQ